MLRSTPTVAEAINACSTLSLTDKLYLLRTLHQLENGSLPTSNAESCRVRVPRSLEDRRARTGARQGADARQGAEA